MTRDTYLRGVMLFALVCMVGLSGVAVAAAQGLQQAGTTVDLQRGSEIVKEMQVVLRHRDAQATSHRYHNFTATRVRTEGDTFIIEGRLTESPIQGTTEVADITIMLWTTPQGVVREVDTAERDMRLGIPSE